MYIGFTLLLAVGAINSQNNLLFLALGLAIGGLLVSGILSGVSLMGVRIERQTPGRASLGRPLRLRYRISNANRLAPVFGLHIVENGGNGRRERLALPWPRFFPQPRTFVVHTPPAGSTDVEVVVAPRARGAIELHGVQVWSTFPFGLTKKSVNFDLARTILVLPPDLPLRSGVLRRLSSRRHSGAGAENLVGRGEEFFGLREYISGDSLRQIAWKRTARTGQFVVRQNAAPSPPRLWVVLNFSAPAASANPGQGGTALSQSALDERAIALAASILRAASREGMAVGLAIPGSRIFHPPREGRAHVDRLLTDLALVHPGELRQNRVAQTPGLSRAGACVVIHAGSVDTAAGPPGSHHLPASGAHQYFAADDEAVGTVLAILDSSADGRSRRRRFRHLRFKARAPGDSAAAVHGRQPLERQA